MGMTKLKLCAISFCMVTALSGCDLQPPSTPSSEASQNATDAYTKAMYIAEAGFAGVSAALETAVDTGVLREANAQKALTLYETLQRQLAIARTTKQQADAVLAHAYIADLWATIAAVRH